MSEYSGFDVINALFTQITVDGGRIAIGSNDSGDTKYIYGYDVLTDTYTAIKVVNGKLQIKE